MSSKHNLPQWNFFRILEEDLEECFAFVEPCEAHYGVYSDQFAAIILLACTEIENALRAFAAWAECEPMPTSINSYCRCILNTYPHLPKMVVSIPRYGLTMRPWHGWTDNSPPEWWTLGYNKIKHDRLKHPTAPTLWRAINALGGLLVVLLHNYRAIHRISSIPMENMPHLYEPTALDDLEWGATFSWSWHLPHR